MNPARETGAGSAQPRPAARRRAVIACGILGYALVAAVCRPLTAPALGAVLVAGIPVCWLGVRRQPPGPVARGRGEVGAGRAGSRSVGVRSAALWLSLLGLGVAFELGLWLGPDDPAHPTLSTLADPVLSTYPGRVLGYVVWAGSGAWLVSR